MGARVVGQVLKNPLQRWASTLASPSQVSNSFPSGVKLLYQPEKTVADIVFVHGLTGDREKTWTYPGASDPWAKTLLPSVLPNARIVTFGYDAYVTKWTWGGRVSHNRIGNHASNLLAALTTFREQDEQNKPPIIFVCHSLGGLVCMDALVKSRNPADPHLKDIFRSTRAIAFLGTPHRGAELAQPAGIVARILGFVKQTNTDVLGALRTDSEVLDRIRNDFHTMMAAPSKDKPHPIEIACFYEELAPKGSPRLIVPEWSATLRGHPSTGIYSDHINMTKFASKEDPGFTLVSGQLQRWIRKVQDIDPQVNGLGSSAIEAGVGGTVTTRHDSHRRPPTSEFKVAIFCALPTEAVAISTLFEHRFDRERPYSKANNDSNTYSCGVIGGHYVVLVHLPGAGKVRAAEAATNCKHSFPNIDLAIIAGVCGAVPSFTEGGRQHEIVLGDIIISTGVVQYDLGRLKADGFKTKDGLNDALPGLRPSIASLLAKLQASKTLQEKMISYTKEDDLLKKYPGVAEDRLFEASYIHNLVTDEQTPCDDSCETDKLIPRDRLKGQLRPRPAIHFGVVASGDTVMMLGTERDKISKRLNAIAFEMEGAGVWRQLPSLVIKAASDYADSHKLKSFQPYAAATAAACTRAILDYWHLPRQHRGPWFTIPYRENQNFSGRDYIMKQLKTEFDPENPREGKFHRRVALVGRPGVGKTQIALAYAYWLKERKLKSNLSIFWVHASNAQRFRQAFVDIATECRIPEYYQNPSADVLLVVKKWLESHNSGDWLMVLDNADDAELFYPEEKKRHGSASNDTSSLGYYLPDCPHGAILVTTRDREVAIDLTETSGIEINKMDPNESMGLLRKRLTDHKKSTDSDLRDLAIRLGCLPFTMVQGAAYIQRNKMRTSELLRLLDQGRLSSEALRQVLDEQVNTHGRDPEAAKETAEMYEVSFRNIHRRDQFASDLLSLMSLLDRQDIPRQLLSLYSQNRPEYQQGGEARLRQALGLLMQWGHIEEDRDDEYDVHRIEQVLTQAWLENRGEKPRFEKDAILTMSQAFPASVHEDPGKYSRYLPHVRAVLELKGTGTEEEWLAKAGLLEHAAGLLLHLDQEKDAKSFLQRAKVIRQETLERDGK